MKDFFNVLIVEDELSDQTTMVQLLAPYQNLKLCGLASNIEQAALISNKMEIDLVFSDVMLPPFTSFDWLSKLSEIPFEIIFTTSFEEFAVKAFKLAAIDYLLKPIDPTDLEKAINRFLSKKESKNEKVDLLLKNLSVQKEQVKIALPTLHGYIFIKISDIIRCESDNTYTTFFTIDKRKILVSKTLKDVEEMLEDYRFFRVHNSHLINTDYLLEYYKGEGGQVKLSDGSVVDVSRRKKDEFMRYIKNK
ncbi:LytR/AlgR family response regulator transcription factor [Cognataquiflexum rubidum]|uniref:LytR/AlgR family response regulator transcription factor n=1 Tax=Cognataquiflexum rubidum TaxID=2922273 RepID=UPI001F139D46|nr:LytTR family DNA-binding domain-containing protein [Cognataquiflexum rubidum]MCH6232475.1 LytTR family DNA-binding domain-containing protein [Cognataquiflexum rubidum]